MALLYSLQICGIRSFSPDNVTGNTITFNTPVTLFLGQNGCGKTTIIESIRYALTGELPSCSSSGQGFVNDPKLSNNNLTKAFVKIKFLDCYGNMITVSKFMSVSAKADGGLTFKKLECVVRFRDKNDPRNPKDLSSRCIDIDSYCTKALKVSKAILNNVLFCHQENSAWPLDESKKLKEKFDEIFEAVKYNKCVDLMRKSIKEKQMHIKVLDERVEYKRMLKDNAEKLGGQYNVKKDKLAKVTEAINGKNNSIGPLEKRLKKILYLEDAVGALQRELTKKQTEKKGIVEQQATIKKHISYIFEGSDEELKNKIKSFQDEQVVEENTIKDLERKRGEYALKMTEINKLIQTLQVKMGQWKEEEKQYKSKVEESKELIEKLRVKLQIDEFYVLEDSECILKRLRNALTQCEESYDASVKQKDAQEKELQNRIDGIREKFASTKQEIASKNSLITEYKNKIKILRNKLDELETSDSQLKTVGDKIEKLQSTLSKLKSSFNETEKLHEIEELKDDIEKKDQFLEKLDREYRILQRNYVTEQKLESEKSFVSEKQVEINRIRSKHDEKLRKLFSDDFPERNFRMSIIEIQNREEMKFKTLTQKINKLERQLTTLETTIKHQKQKLANDQKDLLKHQKTVSELCKGKPFNIVLQESYNKKEKLQKDKGQYSSAKIMYEAFINKFEKDSPCCPVCKTDFANKQSAVKEIVNQLRGKIEMIPTQLVQVEADLKKEEDFYNRLQQLKPLNNEIEMLSNAKIPLMEDEINNSTKDYDEKSMLLAADKQEIEAPQELIEVCKKIIPDFTLLDQYLTDVNRANLAIADLEENIVKVASNRSRQETEAEIDEIKAELSNKKNQCDSSKRMLDAHYERCQSLNKNIQSETQKQIDIQKLVQEKPLLELQNTEYTEKLEALHDEIEQLSDSMTAQEKELTSATEEIKRVVTINRMSQEEEKNNIMTNKNKLREIQRLQNAIDLYVQNDNEGKIESTAQELAELMVNETELEETKNNLTDTISNKKQALAKKESEFRALQDNISLREKQNVEIGLDLEIRKLETEIGTYNYHTIYEEKQRIQEKLETENREISSLSGQKKEIAKQMEELKRELDIPQNKDAFNNYKKQYYEMYVETVAVRDMIKYAEVLEHSILKFHEEHMVTINKKIRELWRSIYRGNDIDYIEIKTDEIVRGGANKRRSYNYKVIQVKSKIELEMRGRCSAGQKVLACLVIRMALAETFSVNCGILALDEPTTNLDRENIHSLSTALSKIVTEKAKEKTFQLLIITHDEDFLNTLTRAQSLESYWNVTRNMGGFSIVEKKML